MGKWLEEAFRGALSCVIIAMIMSINDQVNTLDQVCQSTPSVARD